MLSTMRAPVVRTVCRIGVAVPPRVAARRLGVQAASRLPSAPVLPSSLVRRFASGPQFRANGAEFAQAVPKASGLTMRRGLLAAAAAGGVFAIAAAGAMASETGTGSLGGTKFYPDYVRVRLRDTMTAFGLGVGLTGISAVSFYRMGAVRLLASSPMAFGIGGMVLTIGSMIACQAVDKNNTMAKLGTFALFNASIGLSLAPLALVGGPIIIKAAAYTAGIVGSLAMVAANSPSDQFLWMGGPLAIGLGAVFVSSLGAAFLPASMAVVPLLHNVSLYGGLAVFSGFVLYDVQRIQGQAAALPEEAWDPINQSIHIYLDSINIFVRMVSILAGGNRRK